MLKKKVTAIALVCFIAMSSTLVGCSSDKKEPANTETKQEQPKEEKKVEATKVNSTDMFKAYQDNEVNAKKMYGDKLVEVTGEVIQIGETGGTQYVILKGEDANMFGIQGLLKKDQSDKAASLKKGDTATIVGTTDGYAVNVILKDTVIK